MTEGEDTKDSEPLDLPGEVAKLSGRVEEAIAHLDRLGLDPSTLNFLAAFKLPRLPELLPAAIADLQLPEIDVPTLLSDDAFKPLLTQIESLHHGLHARFQELIPPGLLDFDDQSEEIEAASLALGRAGWYIDINRYSVEETVALAAQLAAGEVEKVNAQLIDHYEKHQDDIVADLVSMFPSRAPILRRTFEAHAQGWYELSIPVMLAQVDGICREKTQKYLFTGGSRGKPATAKYVEAMATSAFERALMAPFSQKLPINLNEKQRGKDFLGLNRHLVLHGDSLDYPSRVNSFKTISLLDYTAHALNTESNT